MVEGVVLPLISKNAPKENLSDKTPFAAVKSTPSCCYYFL